MAAIKDIIRHVTVELAERTRICHRHRNKHKIQKGEKCLAVVEEGGNRKNYCLESALEILKTAAAKLTALEQEIQK